MSATGRPAADRLASDLPSSPPNEPRYSYALPVSAYGGLYFLVLSVPAALAAYYGMFTGFTFWDDEGTMMMRVKDYLAGFRLYDEIMSVYGPVYYFYNWLLRVLSDTPVNHNATRMTSAAVWVVCALLCAWIVFRLTKSVAVASAAHVLTFREFGFFRNEPGHPQELCILLLIALAAGALLVTKPRRRSIGMILVGGMTAALLLVKVNIGVFVILAVALAVLYQSPATTLSCVARIAAATAALVLPPALMKVHLDDSPTRVYCLVVTASTAALLPGLVRAAKTASLSFRDCWIAAASFVTTIAAAFAVMLVQGVSSYAVLDSLVLVNLRENVSQRFWYLPLPMARIWIPWALSGLAAAVVFARLVRRRPERAYELLAPVKLVFGAGALLLAAVPIIAWGMDHLLCCTSDPKGPAMLPGFVTPYCWLLLYPPSEDMESRQAFPRILIATAAVLQTLYAYPLAGSQEVFIRVFLIMVGAVSIGDFLAAKASYRIAAVARVWIRPCAAGLLVCALLYYLALAYRAERDYQALPSLALRGAERIHLPQGQALEYQWLTRNLSENCDVFMGMPNIPSLYFWTAKDAPTRFSLGDWIFGLNDEQQSEVVSALSKHPGACIIYNPGLVALWNKGNVDLSNMPLVRYIRNNFKSIAVMNNYYFEVRKERGPYRP